MADISNLLRELKKAKKELEFHKSNSEKMQIAVLKAEIDSSKKSSMFLRIAARQELRASMSNQLMKI